MDHAVDARDVAIVFLRMGALKFVPNEADTVRPFTANSLLLLFFTNIPITKESWERRWPF
jgi:uncharacterized membrane protein YkgB